MNCPRRRDTRQYVPPNVEWEAFHAIFDEIIDRRLISLHRNSQAIPALHGILEDVIAHLKRIEASNWSDRATEQQHQLFTQVMNILYKADNTVADNR